MLLLKEITLAEPQNQLDRNNAVRQVSQSRALVGYVLIRRLGYKLKDVAKCLGRDAATVGSLVSRFAVRMSENETLRKQTARLAADCRE